MITIYLLVIANSYNLFLFLLIYYSRSYPKQISYQLTRCPKYVPKKQKVKLLTLTCLFVKRKFNETHKDFSINYSYNNKSENTIFNF